MLSNEPWKDQWVCVGGGTSGFGLALAREFALKGAKVAILGRDRERGQLAVEQLKQEVRSEVLFFEVDLAELQIIESSAWFHWLQGISLKVAVAAAGQSDRGYLQAISAQDLDSLWRTNVVTSFLFSQACLASLKRSRGTLVHVASLAGIVATPGLGGYSTVKHALVGMSRQMRLELLDEGVHVLTVCPGPIKRSESEAGRYDRLVEARHLPEELKQPAGTKLVKVLDPNELSRQVVQAIDRGALELVVPSQSEMACGAWQSLPNFVRAVFES